MRRLLALSVVCFSPLVALCVFIANESWDAVAADGAVLALAGGALLWWHASDERKWDEIGRTVMVGALVAILVGLLQYRVEQRQKDRDFHLSLTLQDNLSGADLNHRPLTGVRLRGKNLTDADLHDAVLTHANLIHGTLQAANLNHAKLEHADLRHAHLDDASLIGAHLHSADLKNAFLTGANLRDADLSGAQLDLTHFGGACLAGADLRDATLAGADLNGAVLTGADVRGAKFENDLRPALLNETGLEGVTYNSDTTWPSEFAFWPAVAGHPFPLPWGPGPGPIAPISARVVAVEDGDTIRLETDPAHRLRLPEPGRARLIGVNAPNVTDAEGHDDPDGVAAKHFAEDKLLGETVTVQLGTQPPQDGGRFYVYVWAQTGPTFNEELLDSGHAEVQFKDGQQNEMLHRFHAAEVRAKQRGIGLWRRCPSPE